MAQRSFHISPPVRRRALSLGYVNAALWAIGNSLTTGPLIYYLASDLGASGLSMSLLLALPNLAGVMRLVAPAVVYQAGTARRASLLILSISYLLIVGLPIVVGMVPVLSRPVAVVAMVSLLFAHQLFEYLGVVALWSWWGDLVPTRIRGRYFGRRQIVLLVCTIPTVLISGYFADGWREAYREQPDRLLLAYAIPNGIGAVVLLASLAPLFMMPATRAYPRPNFALAASAIWQPLVDRRFVRTIAKLSFV